MAVLSSYGLTVVSQRFPGFPLYLWSLTGTFTTACVNILLHPSQNQDSARSQEPDKGLAASLAGTSAKCKCIFPVRKLLEFLLWLSSIELTGTYEDAGSNPGLTQWVNYPVLLSPVV